MEAEYLNLKLSKSFGRICISSAYTLKTITYAWLKLDLQEYLGQVISYSHPFERIYLFYCQKYKHIYISEEDLIYIHISALRHDDYKTAALIKLAIDDVREWND